MQQALQPKYQTFQQPPRLKLVVSRNYERTVEDSVRPYRIWDSVERRDVAHRCYAYEKHALDAALLIIRWEKVGRTLEVYDIRTGKWLGTYKRELHSIAFTK